MKTLRDIHRDNKLDIPYPTLLRNTKKLMDDYPNDIIVEGNDITIDGNIIHIVVNGIGKKNKYTKYMTFEWNNIKDDYIENELSYKDVKEKYNLSMKMVEDNLKGLKSQYKKTTIDNKKKDRQRTNQIEGNFNNRFKD